MDVIDLTQDDDPPTGDAPSSQLNDALRRATLSEDGWEFADPPEPNPTSVAEKRHADMTRASTEHAEREIGGDALRLLQVSTHMRQMQLGFGANGIIGLQEPTKLSKATNRAVAEASSSRGTQLSQRGTQHSQGRTQPSRGTQSSQAGTQSTQVGTQLSQGGTQLSRGGTRLWQTRLKPKGDMIALEKPDPSTWRKLARLPTTTICRMDALNCYKLTVNDLGALIPTYKTYKDRTIHLYSAINVEFVAWVKYGGPDAFEAMLDKLQKEWERGRRKTQFWHPVWKKTNLGMETLDFEQMPQRI
ncbi:hypothetical protein EWM64_g2085 [Hericium alpestre]|uniref:Uncharacterized protein n=1 Tax=Hericium alpestre TaxID=135208 RepID=A0A4Z0A4G1_9AGAM|nr:hypothetical protein EWM64_g2085 [Hericium alpestre]